MAGRNLRIVTQIVLVLTIRVPRRGHPVFTHRPGRIAKRLPGNVNLLAAPALACWRGGPRSPCSVNLRVRLKDISPRVGMWNIEHFPECWHWRGPQRSMGNGQCCRHSVAIVVTLRCVEVVRGGLLIVGRPFKLFFRRIPRLVKSGRCSAPCPSTR